MTLFDKFRFIPEGIPSPIIYDTETCGLHGPIVLLQWAEGNGEVHLHNCWKTPIIETLSLIEKIVNHPDGVVGFNLAFDHFHLCQLYTTFMLFPDKDEYPEDHIDEIALLEPQGRDGPCLKPVKAMDLMLHARKGPYQSTMDRGDIVIRRVPTPLAWELAAVLQQRIHLDDLYFARKKTDKDRQWIVKDIIDPETGLINTDFKNVVLKFKASSALKSLAKHAFKLEDDDVLLFADIEINKKYNPIELGYAPFALAIGNRGKWNGAWPEVIKHHINHWQYHDLARKYAAWDVEYTRALWNFFGNPELGDDDSELSCMVGAVRWKGYRVDYEKLAKVRASLVTKVREVPQAPGPVKKWISEVMHPTERVAFKGTGKVILESLTKQVDPDTNEPTQVAIRAKAVLEARQATKRIEVIDKLIRAGRFHASFVVIGTLSSRMAGTDDLNAQGISKKGGIRDAIPMAWPGFELDGGDFESFEVTLAEAAYRDPQLRKDLQSGLQIHAVFGTFVYPNLTYEEIIASKGGHGIDFYTRSKQAVFALFYGGEGYTLQDRLGVDLEVAENAYQLFIKRYPRVGTERKKIFDLFCSMRQPGGIGSRVVWHEPAEYIESLFGFRRYFTLENKICRALYDLANDPPQAWRDLKLRVNRSRERVQTIGGAVQSALFGAAFQLQGSNMRAAANHVIQSAGAQVTKKVQRRIWDIQPSGVNEWRVMPCNIHDEVMVPVKPEFREQVKQAVTEAVEEAKQRVPLLSLPWETNRKSWGGK